MADFGRRHRHHYGHDDNSHLLHLRAKCNMEEKEIVGCQGVTEQCEEQGWYQAGMTGDSVKTQDHSRGESAISRYNIGGVNIWQ